MSPHAAKYPRWADPVATCRAALRIGHLTLIHNKWAFGRRQFRADTVNVLIDAGEAVRVGNHVVAWRPVDA